MAKTFSEQYEKFKAKISGNLKRAAKLVEFEALNLVAIKTGALRDDIKSDPVKRTSSGWEVEIGNQSVYYSVYVHEGVRGQAYNYHRFGTPVFTGNGQKYLQRAVESVGLETIKSIILNG